MARMTSADRLPLVKALAVAVTLATLAACTTTPELERAHVAAWR